MFTKKNPAVIQHKLDVNLGDGGTLIVEPKLDRLAEMVKTTVVTLAIGIPAVILFAFAAHVGSEVLIDRWTE